MQKLIIHFLITLLMLKLSHGNFSALNSIYLNSVFQLEVEDLEIEFLFLIAGGLRHPIPMEKFVPYMVSIRSRNPQKYFGDNHFCAGTIFGKDLVLTTAHCVMDKRRVITKPRRLLLVAGTPNRVEPSNTTIQYPVRSLAANLNFVRKNQNDIAIIRLKGVIPENSTAIKSIRLPEGPPQFGAHCTILGWGRLCRNGPLSDLATHLGVHLFSPEECRQKLPDRFKEGMLCAGENKPFKQDPCRGDSGGPLICNNTLTGIISWTIGCGSFHAASLYTDVWYHRQWIEQQLSKSNNLTMANDILIYMLLSVLIFWRK
ncbi:trypsin II-P29-like [Musca domestica]|uniref:Trypsin II-P29-like n=1 Tax=Musca domestica TaxID=7370 RepID=A0A9J7ICV6_MUSDO|nr:trypsin II-P29-like [Musca domestica]